MKLYYINSSHWDREWYLPFQCFRVKLVETINQLMEYISDNPDYPVFWFDGQTIVLDDYAEIEREKVKKLKELIADNRIKVGPWYVMPDEFLVSGESLIRNLMIGHRKALEFGGTAWKYGYVNDIFGHIAQFPQILNGFGIKGAYLGRGLGNTDFSHFIWRSPDGSECFAYVTEYGKFGRSDINKFGTAEYPELLHNYLDCEIKRSKIPIVLFSNSDDHKMPIANTREVIDNIPDEYPDIEVCDGGPEEMVTEVEKYRDKLITVTGELTKPCKESGNNLKVLFNTLSSYYPLKQLNDICQNRLEIQIEPIAAFLKTDNHIINRGFINEAYKWLIKNQPHDSICGCSIDQVHKDMLYRYDQTLEICDCLCEKYTSIEEEHCIVDDIACEYRLRVYNTFNSSKEKTILAKIWFYKDSMPIYRGYAFKENRNKFKIYNSDNEEIPYQIIKVKKSVFKRNPFRFQSQDEYDVYTVVFRAAVPAIGFADFKILPTEILPYYSETELRHTENTAENKYIRLEIESNGRLKLTDKRNGKTYSDINGIKDDGEVGDGWRHQSPVNDTVITDKTVSADISIISSGSDAVIFKIKKRLAIPQFLDSQTLVRTGESLLSIVSTVSVYKDNPNVYIKTEIDNNARDHRISLTVPTYTKGDEYFAGQAFYCCTRKCGVDNRTKGWLEEDSLVKNTDGIIGKRDKNGNGIAFVSATGLHEGGCDNDEASTINITLFRSFERVFMQRCAKRPQLQQILSFDYAIAPLCKETTYADILHIKHCIAKSEMQYSGRYIKDSLKYENKSYLDISNTDIAMSILKCAEDGNGIIARLYNTTDKKISVKVTPGFKFNGAYICNLNEEDNKPKEIEDGCFNISFKPWEIITIRIS